MEAVKVMWHHIWIYPQAKDKDMIVDDNQLSELKRKYGEIIIVLRSATKKKDLIKHIGV